MQELEDDRLGGERRREVRAGSDGLQLGSEIGGNDEVAHAQAGGDDLREGRRVEHAFAVGQARAATGRRRLRSARAGTDRPRATSEVVSVRQLEHAYDAARRRSSGRSGSGTSGAGRAAPAADRGRAAARASSGSMPSSSWGTPRRRFPCRAGDVAARGRTSAPRRAVGARPRNGRREVEALERAVREHDLAGRHAVPLRRATHARARTHPPARS